MYMDKSYVPKNKGGDSYSLAMIVFRDEVLTFPNVRDRLLTILLDVIDKDRRGEKADIVVLRNTCQILMSHRFASSSSSVFKEYFRESLLQQCAEFYKEEGERFLADSSDAKFANFVQYMIHRIDEEKKRVKRYLDESTTDKLVKMLEKMALVNNNQK